MDKLDADDEGDERVRDTAESDNDQHDILDLEYISSDDEDQYPNSSSCKLSNLNWAPFKFLRNPKRQIKQMASNLQPQVIQYLILNLMTMLNLMMMRGK